MLLSQIGYKFQIFKEEKKLKNKHSWFMAIQIIQHSHNDDDDDNCTQMINELN